MVGLSAEVLRPANAASVHHKSADDRARGAPHHLARHQREAEGGSDGENQGFGKRRAGGVCKGGDGHLRCVQAVGILQFGVALFQGQDAFAGNVIGPHKSDLAVAGRRDGHARDDHIHLAGFQRRQAALVHPLLGQALGLGLDDHRRKARLDRIGVLAAAALAGLHGRQVAGIHFEPLAALQLIFDHFAIYLQKSQARAADLLHDKPFTAKQAGAQPLAKVHVHVHALFGAHERIFLNDDAFPLFQVEGDDLPLEGMSAR